MPAPVTILLDVKPYLKSYLLTLYGPSEPIRFPRRHCLNTFLIRHLGPPPAGSFPKASRAGKVEIALPYSRAKNVLYNHYLSEHDEEALRKELEREFVYDYRCYIKEKMRAGISRKEATELFMEVYNIRDEYLSFSALYRDFSRMLQKRRLTSAKLVI